MPMSLAPRRCRPGAIALLLLLPLFARSVPAQQVTPDTAALSFRGVRAGEHLSQVHRAVRLLGGQRLRCVSSAKDPAVQECRGSFRDSATTASVELWLSVIDSAAAIIAFKASGPVAVMEEWRGGLVRQYGQVSTRIQGAQRMMQWVRKGRMIRLTWRREGPRTVVSVSLVDGRVLDAWGAKP